MIRTRAIPSSLVALAGAAILAQAAAASGEPKNEWPFTRPVGDRSTQAAHHRTTTGNPPIQGEPKNEPPFTRPATVVLVTNGGFRWADGGIGAAIGVGITLSGVGAVALGRKSPRRS